MNKHFFEKLTEDRLPDLLAIYNHYVVHTTATFHAHPLTEDEMRAIVLSDDPKYGTYVIIANGAPCGYVMLSRHKNREAYDGTAEVTVYLAPEHTGKGLGGSAVRYIEDIARKSGIHVLIATICGENGRSIGLFGRNGYDRCAHYREVGTKFGRYLDVVAYQKIL